MIITYPIQIPYTSGNHHRVMPHGAYACSEIASGTFPMGRNRFWHGGVHMTPENPDVPIRAIADGEVVAYRYDEVDSSDPFFDKTPYSRSFVLLKHVAELGETTLGVSKLEFYSLYMHLGGWNKVKGKNGSQAVNFLKKIVPERPKLDKNGNPVLDKKKQPILVKADVEVTVPTADGECHSGDGYARVKRGDILGYSGVIPDSHSSPSRGIHFEIFFDDVSFLKNPIKAIWGKCVLTTELAVCNEMLQAVSFNADPSKFLKVNKSEGGGGYQCITVDKKKYWVSEAQLTLVDTPIKTKGGGGLRKEYVPATGNLKGYTKNPQKNEKVLPVGTSIIPWADPLLKPEEFRQERLGEKDWIQVYVPESNDIYWAEKSSINFCSDADWNGFRLIEEHGIYSDDGFVDDAGMQDLLKSIEANTSGKDSGPAADSNEKLRFVIAKHPTEWSKKDIDKRFGRVKQEDFGAGKLTAEQFSRLSTHIERLCFWEDVKGLPGTGVVWHPHPIKFIEQLGKCLWLSKNELAEIYPDKSSTGSEVSHGTPAEVREKYRLEINKCNLKYGINTRLRQAHFFGQGAVESGSLNSMLEIASGAAYENNRQLGNTQPGDGPKFKGRGFKQLTGRYNYAKYWVFKGWLTEGRDFDVGWEVSDAKRFPRIDNPDKLMEVHYCIDAGCWYISVFRKRTMAAIDKDDVRAVTFAINGGYNAVEEREQFTNRIRRVLL